MKTDISRESMYAELDNIIASDWIRIQNLYGELPEMTEAKLVGLPIMKSMDLLYDYAIEGQISASVDIAQILHEVTDFILEVVPHSAMIEGSAIGPFSYAVCAVVVNRAVARWRFDESSVASFSIKDLAFLTGMDERSVRNAANPKLPDPLKTFVDAEGSTQVHRSDAVAWLKGRRGFRFTTFVDLAGAKAIPTGGFDSPAELLKFMEGARSADLPPIQTLLDKAGLQSGHPAWKDPAAGRYPFDPDAFASIAIDLHLDRKAFQLAALKTFQKAEIAWLESLLDS